MMLISILAVGFLLGMRHATDADHVIAVTTIVSRERTMWSAALIGAVWGLGHTLTVMMAGGAIVLFGLVIPARVGLGMELSVGLMLVLLGIWNLQAFSGLIRPFFGNEEGRCVASIHPHPHRHGRSTHTHPHGRDLQSPTPEWETTARPRPRLESRWGAWPIGQALRPLAVGVVHGLAGSAAVALLVLPIIREPLWAIAYLAVFGAGTIAGMMLITAAMAWPISRGALRSAAWHRRLGLASGFLSLGFGAFMIYEIGFRQGLFIK